MKKITEMSLEEILDLHPAEATDDLTAEEVVHIARTLGAYWEYDYDAARKGRPGFHAELKSKRHSDAFFVSHILLAPKNIRRVMAMQMAIRLLKFLGTHRPDYVAGIPDGATSLGEEVADIFHSKVAKMAKVDGKITLLDKIGTRELLLVEDFCTRGTGFDEAASGIHASQPEVDIMLYNPVILNRGGRKHIVVPEVGIIPVVSVVEKKIEDWDAKNCPLCKEFDSKPIKPKETKENWELLTTSQL